MEKKTRKIVLKEREYNTNNKQMSMFPKGRKKIREKKNKAASELR